MKKALDWKTLIPKSLSRLCGTGDDSASDPCAMHDSQIATQTRIASLLRTLDENRPKNRIELDDSHHYGRAGEIYWLSGESITVLCENTEEVCVYQGSLPLVFSRDGFSRLIAGREGAGWSSPSYKPQRLSVVEVEFILGILSAMDPMYSWTVLGNDLQAFIASNRRNLNRWTSKIVSLLLTQMLLKKYTGKLYQRLSSVIVDGVWSEVAETVPTDDAHVTRLAGYLIGSYKSEEFMEKVLDARCSVFFHSLETLETLVEMGETGHAEETDVKERMDRLLLCFRRMGTQVSAADVQTYMKEAESHPGEIRRAVQILRNAFAGKE
ncbi:MAG: hypothetical protein ACLGPL_06430 [Acidobacteriota bacterium]